MRWVVLVAVGAACYSPLAYRGGDGGGPGGSDAGPPSGAPVMKVGVGARFACALDGSGEIACWGDNGSGQLGNGTVGGGSSVPAVVGQPGGAWTDLAVGGSHVCGLAGGEVYCWGDDSVRQLGYIPSSASPMQVLPQSNLVAVSAGAEISCALDAGSGLWCWGQLDALSQFMPTQLANQWTQISVGYDHACGITTAGDIECFGPCGDGSGGAYCGTPIGSDTPQLYALSLGAASARRVVAGPNETCAIDIAGHLACAGLYEAFTDMQVWTDVSIGATIDNELQDRCGVVGGTARCWGTDELGGFGDGQWIEAARGVGAAVAVGSASRVVVTQPAIEAEQDADEIGCLIDNDQRLQCWGGNRSGELGGPPTQQPPTRVADPDGNGWVQVASSSTHTCGVTNAGALYCWGQNDLGEITGDPSSTACPSGICAAPTAAAMTTASDGLVVGEGFTCIGNGTAVTCWGDNSHGQLGAGDPGDHAAQTLPGLIGLVGGGNDACAVDTANDDELACWGWYQPEGSDLTVSHPVPLGQWLDGAIDTPTAIWFTQGSVCSLGSAASTDCWGDDSFGERGNGTFSGASETPSEAVGPATALAGAFRHYCAVATDVGDGTVTVYCWGDDYADEVGAVQDSEQLAPMPEPITDVVDKELGNCTAVTTGLDFSCAVCGGSAQCWGFSTFGALGQAGPANKLADAIGVAVPFFDVSAIAGGGFHRDDHACALGSGQLACWGYGPRGELGLGSDVHGSALPVPIAIP
jgi:alpha-tubulin suppressor-like RCC1 family protein